MAFSGVTRVKFTAAPARETHVFSHTPHAHDTPAVHIYIQHVCVCIYTLGLGIDTNFTIRFRFRFDSILIILDISYNKWQFFSRESNLLTNGV